MEHTGLWWEAAKSRLWTVTAVDYTNVAYPVQVFTRSLNDDGTVTNVHGPIGLTGIPAKRVYGGVQPVPEWFQTQYGSALTQWDGVAIRAWSRRVAVPRWARRCTRYRIPAHTRIAREPPTDRFKTLMDRAGVYASDWVQIEGA